MTEPVPLRFLIQPGWQNSGSQHWQTLWQQRLGPAAERVEQNDWLAPECAAWRSTLAAAIRTSDAPTVVLAHSIGAVAAVFALEDARPLAVVLVAPADAEREGAPAALHSFTPIPMAALEVPALVIASENDPYCEIDRARAMADAWKADLEIVPGGGHLNADAGFGAWPEGWLMVGEWLRRHGLDWPGATGDGGTAQV